MIKFAIISITSNILLNLQVADAENTAPEEKSSETGKISDQN